MIQKIFVSDDTTSLAVGAEEVASELRALMGAKLGDCALIRNGSRGLFWLEPLVEMDWRGTRHAFGPVEDRDAAGLVSADGSPNFEHPKYLGPTEEISELKAQNRFTLDKLGLADPLDFEAYRANGGLEGLRIALGKSRGEIVSDVIASGLRGRGGAGFPAGIKMKTVSEAGDGKKYVVCNADEGDSGTFADRMVLEGDPFMLIEGMVIAALGSGADKGYIYLRSEYPRALEKILAAIEIAEQNGLLGRNVMESGLEFALEVRVGAGAYICGEETSLLESLEGKPGLVRSKPPLPALFGLFGKPTLLNNLLTLASLPNIFRFGPESYAKLGSGRSLGTLTVQLAGNVRRGGLYEFPFGVSLKKVIEEYGGGTLSGKPVKCVQVGGPLGTFIPAEDMDLPLDYEAFAATGAMVGHGGVVVFDETANIAELALHSMEFCARESCGKCTPCRIGSTRGAEVIQRLIAGKNFESNRKLLLDLCQTMREGSLCAMGGLTPLPVESALKHFESDFSKISREQLSTR